MKKVISVLIICILLVSTAFADNEIPSFRLQYFGIIQTEPDGNFHADEFVTRAEMAKIIFNMVGRQIDIDVEQTPINYIDVPAEHWASGYIFFITSYGAANGYPDGTFRPDDNINFAEAVTMIVHILGYEYMNNNYTDKGTDYPEEYLRLAEQYRLTDYLDKIPDSYEPQTWEGIAKLINRALDSPLYVGKVFSLDGYLMDGTNGNVLKTILTEYIGVRNELFWYFDKKEDMELVGLGKKITTENNEEEYLTLSDDELAYLVEVKMDGKEEIQLFYVVLKLDGGFYTVNRFVPK